MVDLDVKKVEIFDGCYLINGEVSVPVDGDHRYAGFVKNWIESGGVLLDAPVTPKTLDEQTALANAECSKRINAHWNQIGQINASLGVYGEEDSAACAAWISSNRAALVALLAREDLLEIDITDDQYWPVFE